MATGSTASAARLFEHLNGHQRLTLVREAQDWGHRGIHFSRPTTADHDTPYDMVTWRRVADEHRGRGSSCDSASVRDRITDRFVAQAPGCGGRP